MLLPPLVASRMEVGWRMDMNALATRGGSVVV
jgi:hypothetical protein